MKVYNASQLHPTSRVVSEKEYRKLEERLKFATDAATETKDLNVELMMRLQKNVEMLQKANAEITKLKRALDWSSSRVEELLEETKCQNCGQEFSTNCDHCQEYLDS